MGHPGTVGLVSVTLSRANISEHRVRHFSSQRILKTEAHVHRILWGGVNA